MPVFDLQQGITT